MVDEMSTELVVPGQKKGKEFLTQEQVKNWLTEVSTGSSSFVSVVPAKLVRDFEAFSKYSNMWGFTGVLFASISLIDMVIFAFPSTASGGGYTEMGFGLYFAAICGPAAGMSGLVPLLLPHWMRRKRKQVNSIMALQALGVQSWLKARYGITVPRDVLPRIALDAWIGREIKFADVTNRQWIMVPFRAETNETHWRIEEKKTETRVEAVTAEAAVSSVVILPNEAKTLHESIKTRLGVLGGYNLSVDSAHSVRRAEQEAAQAISTYQKLDRLGEAESGYSGLVEVLSEVNEELHHVVQSEAGELRKQLAVQSNYLRDKKSGRGSSSLELDSIAAPINNLQVEKKVVGN